MRPQHLPVLIAALVLSACTEMSKLPSGADTGPNPTLPEPNTTLIPTVKIAPAKGWPAGVTPKAAAGHAREPRSPPACSIRAGCTCCRTATCWSPRPLRPSGRRRARASRAA